MESKPELDSELESFRRKWKTELQFNVPVAAIPRETQPAVPSSSSSKAPPPRAEAPKPLDRKYQVDDDEDYVKSRSFDAPASTSASGRTLVHPENEGKQELLSALDHYEAAVEKEAIGSLGDSLKLYRTALRMDHRVDLAYRKKHFAAQWQKAPASSSQPNNTQQQKQQQQLNSNTAPKKQVTQEEAPTPSISDLIASFSGLAVSPAPAPVEGNPPPPCPMSELPQEILTHIFTDVAIADVGDLTRLSLVCKRFAYLIATESQLWRCTCMGDEFGFPGMQYHWQTGPSWGPFEEGSIREVMGGVGGVGGSLPLRREELSTTEDGDGYGSSDEDEYVSMTELAQRRRDENLATTLALLPAYSSSWKSMFRHRPRIRFNGCYISTVNYIRAGQASVTQFATLGSPVHIVTYYRYLRFFRDGTAISLLTTSEPGEVVHHLTKPLLTLHQNKKGEGQHLPSVAMRHALRGRWRLSSAAAAGGVAVGVDNNDNKEDRRDGAALSLKDSEGDLFVETESSLDKYMYRMELAMRSAGKGARNNKLAWEGFYSYNKLTDDWAEFALKNDKPFFFSRVRSYGARGE